MGEMLYVLAASYDDVGDAIAEYEAIEVAYRHVASSHDFDATVIAKDEAGKLAAIPDSTGIGPTSVTPRWS